MKHYADEKNNKSAPRHSAKSSGGKRYAAPEHKPRYGQRSDRYEKKPTELRIKPSAKPALQKSQPADGATRIYPVKKSDISKLEKQRRPRTDVPATPTAPVPRTKLGYLPAFLFAGFILTMMVWFVGYTVNYFATGKEKVYSASEKRILADFPKVLKDDADAKSVAENIADGYQTVASGEFGKGFETFFADHFPARNFWVGTNAYATLAEGNNGANGVYYCGNGYLINTPVPKKNQIDNNLELLTDFKSDIGDVPMTAMFVPSTGYIVSDVLPPVHNTYNDDKYFDDISQTLKAGGVNFVDLRSSFKSAYKDGKQLYYKTDHHWTTLGAYTAYRQLCDSLGLTAAEESAFTKEKYDKFYGTTYSKGGFWFTQPDTVEVWNNPKNTEDAVTVSINDGKPPYKTQNSMFFYEHAKEDDKYPIFIDGNHAFTEITNKNAKGGTIVVIKDSFSHCMAPFLAENYSRVIMVDMRYYNQDVTQLVKIEKPEQVLVLYGIDNFAEDTDLGHLWG